MKTNKRQPDLKINRASEDTFFQKRHTDGQQACGKIFHITNQGNANQSHDEISPHTCQNGYYKKDNKEHVLARMWRKGNPSTILKGM